MHSSSFPASHSGDSSDNNDDQQKRRPSMRDSASESDVTKHRDRSPSQVRGHSKEQFTPMSSSRQASHSRQIEFDTPTSASRRNVSFVQSPNAFVQNQREDSVPQPPPVVADKDDTSDANAAKAKLLKAIEMFIGTLK